MILACGAAGNAATERGLKRRERAKAAERPWSARVREQSSAMTPVVSDLTEGLKLPKIRRTRRAKQRYLQARVEVLAVPIQERPS